MSRLNDESLEMLNRKKGPENYLHFIVMGDSHLINKGWNEEKKEYDLDKNGLRYKKILKEIAKKYNQKLINPMFIIHGGDLVNEGTEENFKAFVAHTQSVLNPIQLPMFASIGNHDYTFGDSYNYPVHYNFEKYIGGVRGEILIPNTNVKFVRLNTHYTGYYHQEPHVGFLSSEDFQYLPKRDLKYHYLIDFHTPLRVCDYTKTNDKFHFLSKSQTRKFTSALSENICGVFSHHKHTHYACSFNWKKQSIPYIVTGGAGTHATSVLPHFYYCTLDLENYRLLYKRFDVK